MQHTERTEPHSVPLRGRYAYRYFGAQPCGESFSFRVWAPHADSVHLCGDFNGWSPCQTPLQPIGDGIWEVYVPATTLRTGTCYQYFLRHGERSFFKADPYARAAERPPALASVLPDLSPFPWRDAGWLEHRKKCFTRATAPHQPLNIYELHAPSWMRTEAGEPLSYEALARELSSYVKQMGYTHVALLPLATHPFEGSWGYRVTSYFAPSARQGSPRELMEFINVMHEAGIGVFVDLPFSSFPKDAHGLYEFDGEPLYEPTDPCIRENDRSGTRNFDYTRPEVRELLISNALYWAKEYHVDGIRITDVAEMTEHRFDRRDGRCCRDAEGVPRCTAAEEFLRELNRTLREEFPDVMTVATAEAEARPRARDPLGFTFRLNTGWTTDVMSYAGADPRWRCNVHERLTRALGSAFSEHSVLPISHDEVVHGKRSLLDRMPGSYEEKFAQVRLFLTYLMTHPGKKLTFMGSEIGQFREWSSDGGIEWFLLDFPMHARLQLCVAELNHLYLRSPQLWETDDSFGGFRWIDAGNDRASLLSYRRIDRGGEERIVLLNFSTTPQENFLLAVPEAGEYREVFNSDSVRYGGTGMVNPTPRLTEECDLGGYRHGIRLALAPLAATVLRRL